MTITTPMAPPESVAGNGIPLLDPHPRRMGPVSRRLLTRFVAGIALVQLAGAVLTFVVAGDRARAAGLSLTFPGGGFLHLARPGLFVLTSVALVVALVLWWGLSAHAAIPVVWLGSALAAWALVDAPRLVGDRDTTWGWAIPVVYALAVAVLAAMVWKFERRFRSKRAAVAELNDYLASVELTVPERAPREPNDMDAELLRFCYDLAHQPDDGLTGFDWGEQFHGGTQLRYQLNAHCWALSLYAANYVPNAPAQITDALERLVAKHTDLRVWKYWRTLNVLGNLDTNPDPIVRDNIMFSAFLGDVLNIFEAATGSTRFDEPGSLTFVWKDGREFPYDHHSIIEAVNANYERSTLGFYPCEPGWSFTVCNVMGAQSMYGHDRLHGTELWERNRDGCRTTLEQEYLTPDGTYAHIRSNHVGLSWDTGEVPGGHYTANGTGRFADILPAHGDRARALDLRGAEPAMARLSAMITDGTLPLEMPHELERHRTSSTALPGWNKVIGGARLVGDEGLAEAAMDGAERQCGTGSRWPDRPLDAGSSAFGGHMIVRWAMPMSLADLNRRGYVAPAGPVLEETEWDLVMVTLARSDDGETLELAVRPRHADAAVGEVELGFAQLVAGAAYRAEDADGETLARFVADATGRSMMRLDVAGPSRLRVVPS
ncbi:hypothetical protein [Ilumatobacter sp.]|uniref:linalool dehydratase/isomerase domain-containing protein n=1 Tax=Ilumatobacter sp. TaxID=1967498 RepID=UPI003B52F8A7